VFFFCTSTVAHASGAARLTVDMPMASLPCLLMPAGGGGDPVTCIRDVAAAQRTSAQLAAGCVGWDSIQRGLVQPLAPPCALPHFIIIPDHPPSPHARRQEVFLGGYTYRNTSIVTPWLTPTVTADAVSARRTTSEGGGGTPSPSWSYARAARACAQVFNHSLRVVNYFSWYLDQQTPPGTDPPNQVRANGGWLRRKAHATCLHAIVIHGHAPTTHAQGPWFYYWQVRRRSLNPAPPPPSLAFLQAPAPPPPPPCRTRGRCFTGTTRCAPPG
jgi:hypothetical protein